MTACSLHGLTKAQGSQKGQETIEATFHTVFRLSTRSAGFIAHLQQVRATKTLSVPLKQVDMGQIQCLGRCRGPEIRIHLTQIAGHVYHDHNRPIPVTGPFAVSV